MVHILTLPVLATPTPMSPVCFTSVTRQRPILDRAVWYSDPLSRDEHLHPLASPGRAQGDNPPSQQLFPPLSLEASRCRGLRWSAHTDEEQDRKRPSLRDMGRSPS